MPLFEYAIIRKPTEDERKAGVQETLIKPPTPIIAKDQAMAQMMAIRQLPADYTDEDLQRTEVAVRPF